MLSNRDEFLQRTADITDVSDGLATDYTKPEDEQDAGTVDRGTKLVVIEDIMIREDRKNEDKEEDIEYMDDVFFDNAETLSTEDYKTENITTHNIIIKNTKTENIMTHNIKTENVNPKVTIQKVQKVGPRSTIVTNQPSSHSSLPTIVIKLPRTEACPDPIAKILSNVPQKGPPPFSGRTRRPPRASFIEFEKYKQLQDRYKALNKKFKSIKTKKKPTKELMFQTLTANMNPVARQFFHTQLWQKSTKGVRFTPEEKILALSIMKLSRPCYRLLRKIFILPSFNTLQIVSQSIMGKNTADQPEQLPSEVLHDDDEGQDNDEAVEDDAQVLQENLSQLLMPGDITNEPQVTHDDANEFHALQDNLIESNEEYTTINESQVSQYNVDDSQVLQYNVNNQVLQYNVNNQVLQYNVNNQVLQYNVNNQVLQDKFNRADVSMGSLNAHTHLLSNVPGHPNVSQEALVRNQVKEEPKKGRRLKDMPIITPSKPVRSEPELETPLASLFDSMTNKFKRKGNVEKPSTSDWGAQKARTHKPTDSKNQSTWDQQPESSGYYKKRKI